jgi:MADS-box transcription factor
MDSLAHRPMTVPNPPIPVPSSSFSAVEPHVPTDRTRLIHSGRPLQEDMDPRGSGYRYPPPYHSQHYPPYYPMSPPPSQSLIPGGPFDYHPRSHHYRHMNYPPSRSYHPLPDPYMRLTAQQYHASHQSHGYPPVMYPPPPPQQQHTQHPGDMFAALLEGDPRHHSAPGYAPIDWPQHAPLQGAKHEQGARFFSSSVRMLM